eukprot:Tbor_TRINITY_DN5893_c0_g2::TRINITY_DN5893_c0_g2_i4::g.6479::m.6479
MTMSISSSISVVLWCISPVMSVIHKELEDKYRNRREYDSTSPPVAGSFPIITTTASALRSGDTFKRFVYPILNLPLLETLPHRYSVKRSITIQIAYSHDLDDDSVVQSHPGISGNNIATLSKNPLGLQHIGPIFATAVISPPMNSNYNASAAMSNSLYTVDMGSVPVYLIKFPEVAVIRVSLRELDYCSDGLIAVGMIKILPDVSYAASHLTASSDASDTCKDTVRRLAIFVSILLLFSGTTPYAGMELQAAIAMLSIGHCTPEVLRSAFIDSVGGFSNIFFALIPTTWVSVDTLDPKGHSHSSSATFSAKAPNLITEHPIEYEEVRRHLFSAAQINEEDLRISAQVGAIIGSLFLVVGVFIFQQFVLLGFIRYVLGSAYFTSASLRTPAYSILLAIGCSIGVLVSATQLIIVYYNAKKSGYVTEGGGLINEWSLVIVFAVIGLVCFSLILPIILCVLPLLAVPYEYWAVRYLRRTHREVLLSSKDIGSDESLMNWHMQVHGDIVPLSAQVPAKHSHSLTKPSESYTPNDQSNNDISSHNEDRVRDASVSFLRFVGPRGTIAPTETMRCWLPLIDYDFTTMVICANWSFRGPCGVLSRIFTLYGRSNLSSNAPFTYLRVGVANFIRYLVLSLIVCIAGITLSVPAFYSFSPSNITPINQMDTLTREALLASPLYTEAGIIGKSELIVNTLPRRTSSQSSPPAKVSKYYALSGLVELYESGGEAAVYERFNIIGRTHQQGYDARTQYYILGIACIILAIVTSTIWIVDRSLAGCILSVVTKIVAAAYFFTAGNAMVESSIGGVSSRVCVPLLITLEIVSLLGGLVRLLSWVIEWKYVTQPKPLHFKLPSYSARGREQSNAVSSAVHWGNIEEIRSNTTFLVGKPISLRMVHAPLIRTWSLLCTPFIRSRDVDHSNIVFNAIVDNMCGGDSGEGVSCWELRKELLESEEMLIPLSHEGTLSSSDSLTKALVPKRAEPNVRKKKRSMNHRKNQNKEYTLVTETCVDVAVDPEDVEKLMEILYGKCAESERTSAVSMNGTPVYSEGLRGIGCEVFNDEVDCVSPVAPIIYPDTVVSSDEGKP